MTLTAPSPRRERAVGSAGKRRYAARGPASASRHEPVLLFVGRASNRGASMHAEDMSAKASSGQPSGLGFAVWSDNGVRVRKLLAGGTPADDYGDGIVDKTPLMESVDELEAFYDSDRADLTRLLLEHRADVHRRDRDGRTALHYAVGAGRTAVLLLLEAGADPNAAATDGSTPLHEAVRRMNAGSVAALCISGGDRAALDQRGRTPLEVLADEVGAEEERAAILMAMA